jgi:hypothetical protein
MPGTMTKTRSMFVRSSRVALATGALFLAVGCSAEAVDDTSTGGSEEVSSDAITGTIPAGTRLVATRAVNFRSAASTSSTVLDVIPEGGVVVAAGGPSQNGFYRVTYQGRDGFAFGTFLDRETAGGGNFTTSRTVTLLWQGNWDFLTQCDTFSTNGVRFACQAFVRPTRDFVDNGLWVAAPGSLQGSSNRLCGRQVQVCKGDVCRTATVVERSVESSASKWEGSTALVKAFGEVPGFTSCTRSFGSVNNVTIRY